MKYVLITYIGETIRKDACRVFESDIPDINMNPYELAPFVVGSNQAIFHIEDSPIEME